MFSPLGTLQFFDDSSKKLEELLSFLFLFIMELLGGQNEGILSAEIERSLVFSGF